MGIKDPEFVNLVNQIEEIEQKIFAHPLHKVLFYFLLFQHFVSVLWDLSECEFMFCYLVTVWSK